MNVGTFSVWTCPFSGSAGLQADEESERRLPLPLPAPGALCAAAVVPFVFPALTHLWQTVQKWQQS